MKLPLTPIRFLRYARVAGESISSLDVHSAVYGPVLIRASVAKDRNQNNPEKRTAPEISDE